jgi:hypothetical protein
MAFSVATGGRRASGWITTVKKRTSRFSSDYCTVKRWNCRELGNEDHPQLPGAMSHGELIEGISTVVSKEFLTSDRQQRIHFYEGRIRTVFPLRDCL